MNWYELRESYEILHLLKQHADNDFVINLKRKIREYHKKTADTSCKIVKSEFEYAVELATICDGDAPEEVAEMIFMSTMFMDYPCSPYDCTGKLFTEWYKLFRRCGKWMVYHCVGADV